jgi:hypothetical protein
MPIFPVRLAIIGLMALYLSPETFYHQQPMFRVSQENLRPMVTYGVSIFLSLALAIIGFSGCANTNQPGQSQNVTIKSQSQEVNAFFVAGNEAHYRGLLCNSSGNVDLSAYSRQMGVKYPRTVQVDVLKAPPARPYKSFAMLECKPGPYSKSEEVLEGLKSKAREIGADAIILCGSGLDQGQAGIPPSSTIQAEAIRYILRNSSEKENKS